MAVLLVPVVDIEEKLVVVVPDVEDTLVAVAQSVTAAPLRLVVPAHIASHSSLAAPVLLAVAEAVIVLRFPLYSLYMSKNQCISGYYCCFSIDLIWNGAVSTLPDKHIILGVF